MTLNLNHLELKQLLIWADNTISGGHYGNGDVIFPEEGATLYKVKNAIDGAIEVTLQDIKVMLIWCENAIGMSLKGMTSEEITLIDKLKIAQKQNPS